MMKTKIIFLFICCLFILIPNCKGKEITEQQNETLKQENNVTAQEGSLEPEKAEAAETAEAEAAEEEVSVQIRDEYPADISGKSISVGGAAGELLYNFCENGEVSYIPVMGYNKYGTWKQEGSKVIISWSYEKLQDYTDESAGTEDNTSVQSINEEEILNLDNLEDELGHMGFVEIIDNEHDCTI